MKDKHDIKSQQKCVCNEVLCHYFIIIKKNTHKLPTCMGIFSKNFHT